MKTIYPILGCLILSGFVSCARVSAREETYDPLKIAEPNRTAPIDLTVRDAARNREIPVRIYLPTTGSTAPVVLFSHGLGGSAKGNEYLGRHWSARGYVAVFLQHPGSDTSVWQGKPASRRMNAMNQAANGRNFMLRVKDVPAVLDQLERWQKTSGHPVAGRLDLARVGMSGHSFGAITTQAVSGQNFGRLSVTDPRIKAAIAFSPSGPRNGGTADGAFGGVKLPWMLMTGTNDTAPIGNIDMASRLSVYPALPPGGKYELVLEKAEHSAFTDRALPGDRETRNPNHHRAILALSTAFWDAYLRGDAGAKAWLDGDGARSVLEPKDRWRHK
ncbi:MAG: hypothetical protein SFU56_00055 [Capsulimonadales bacterium]|nr:hypothetical protein [Capsulimonadales bacterium]